MARPRKPTNATLERGARTRAQDRSLETADRLHSAAIHLLRRVRREDAATGIPAPQLSALSVIVFRGPITLGALATAEQVRPPTITRIVGALEAGGLIERTVDPEDRRSTQVRATARGAETMRQGRRRRVESLARELEALRAADLDRLERALDVLERIVGGRHNRATD